MKHISEIIEDILVEWAYRVHDGMPNPTNPQHIIELRESMEELNLPNNVIYQVINNLINEVTDKETEFKARSKETNKIIYYKNQDNLDAGIKSGHAIPFEKSDGEETETDTGKLSADDFDTEKTGYLKKDKDGEEKGNDETSVDSNRQQDHQDTDAALNYTKTQEKKDKESGTSDFDKGQGTHASRAGEAATHKALRMLKEGKSYEQIEEYLMSIANDKDTFLDKSWVKASLAATKQIEQTFGLDSIDEIVWDTKSGHKTIGVENHGTSADMFVKLKDGTRVGISLKKDGKVFIKNGGYKEVFKQMVDDLRKSGVPEEDIKRLEELASKESYDKDLLNTMSQAASVMDESDVVKSVIEKIKSDDNYASELNLLGRRDKIDEDFFKRIQEKIKNGKKLSGDEQKIMARIAASPEVR